MTDQEYRAAGGITATALKAGRVSMRHMYAVMTQAHDEPTPAMVKGRHIHTAILEPVKMADYVVWPGSARRGKEWDKFAADNANREIITKDEQDELHLISNAVHSHRTAHGLLCGVTTEQPLFWSEPTYGSAQCRPDAFNRSVLIDIKSTSGITPREFGRQFIGLGYEIQLGWYWHGLRANGVKPFAAYIIAVESKPPYDVAVYEVPLWLIDRGYAEADRIACAYRACCACECWPGVADDIQPLQVPEWYAGDESEGVVPSGEMSVSEL